MADSICSSGTLRVLCEDISKLFEECCQLRLLGLRQAAIGEINLLEWVILLLVCHCCQRALLFPLRVIILSQPRFPRTRRRHANPLDAPSVPVLVFRISRFQVCSSDGRDVPSRGIIDQTAFPNG